MIVFVSILIVWSTVFKRNIAEGALIGFIAVGLFGGKEALNLLWEGMAFASTFSVIYAAIVFILMAYIIDQTNIVAKLLGILNSLVGRLPGAPAIMDALGSVALGTLSGGDAANTASTGSVTGPWMVRDKWDREVAATVLAGNGGLAGGLPPTTSMFIVLGFAPVAAAITTGEFYLALLAAGSYQIVHRLIVIWFFVKKYNIKSKPAESLKPLSQSFREGWTSIFIYLGALIPLVATIGPLAKSLTNSIGEQAMSAVDIIVWIPTLMVIIALIIGYEYLPKSIKSWGEFFKKSIPKFSVVGPLIFFAIGTSHMMNQLGLSEDITALISNIHIPVWLFILLIGILMTAAAGPLMQTGALTAIGLVSYEALVSVEVAPMVAAVAIMTFSSTSAAMPPVSGSIFIASSLVEAKVEKMFGKLIFFYVIPVILIGWLIGMGIFPIYGGG